MHGYKQTYGVDFCETYASVLDYDVALFVLGYFTGKGTIIHQVDFFTAFLNGDIE